MYSRSCVFAAVGLLSFSLQAGWGASEEPEVVFIKGHKADATRILARTKSRAGLGPQTVSRLETAGVKVKQRIGLAPGLLVLEGAPGPSLAKASASLPTVKETLLHRLQVLRDSGLFDYVEPDYIVSGSAIPTDSSFTDGTLWGLQNTGQSGGTNGADIGAAAAWDLTTGSTNVIVAVIDSGIRYTHQELAQQMWRNPGEIPGNGQDDDQDGFVDNVHGINVLNDSGDPMDENDHGTHCAGTIGASANDGNGLVGVAWDVRLMACKFLDEDGSGKISDALQCIDFAVAKGARVLNCSWSGAAFSQALYDSVAGALSHGVVFVGAAGNESENNDLHPNYPSSLDLANVIAVTGLDRRDNAAEFANYGRTTVHLGAPAVEILSCGSASDSDYKTFSGTSMAAPYVSGAAALLLARFPSLSLVELRNRLLSSAVPVAALTNRTVSGGRLNVFRALALGTDVPLRATVTPGNGGRLAAGSTVSVFVKVESLAEVTNAVVTGTIGGGPALAFRNDGTLPDARGGDEVYSSTLTVPVGVSSLTLNLAIEAPGKAPLQLALNYVVSPPGFNDNLADRIPIVGTNAVVNGSNVNATLEPGEPLDPDVQLGKSVWWTWTAPLNGIVTITTEGSDFDTFLAVYTGTDLGNLIFITSNDDVDDFDLSSQVRFAATAGTAYHIAVLGVVGAFSQPESGPIRLGLSAVASTSGPGNDTFANRFDLDGTVVEVRGSNVQATKESGEPDHAGKTGGASVWWTWAAPASGTARVSTQGSTFDTLLGVYTGGVVNALTLVAANDDKPGGVGISEVTFNAAIGTTYQIAVDGLGGATGAIVLSLDEIVDVAPPTNDHFANRILIPGASATVSGINTNATKEIGEPDHAGNLGGKSLWWSWVAEAAGEVTVTTEGSSFDTLLAVYTGSAVSNLVLVASNDEAEGGSGQSNHTSRVAFTATAGTRYEIAVDGYRDFDLGGADSGVVSLRITGGTPPAFRFQSVRQLLDGGIELQVTGSVGKRYRVDFSPDLKLWSEFTNVVNQAGLLTLVDNEARTRARGYYRLLQLD
jgi:subtilisin family serine protease